MRISGLASGLDTETMVKDLMKAQRIPLDKLTQKKTYLEWQLDSYRTVNRKLNDFSTFTFDGIMKQSTFIQKSVSVSSADDISVRNVNSTVDFSGTINVERLAKAASMQSSGRVLSSDADLKKKLTEIKPSIKLPASFTVQAIDKEGKLDEGYEVKVTEDSTVQSILDDINKNSGVTAMFDSFRGQIVFTAKNTGDVAGDSEIKVSGDFAKYFLMMDTNNDVAATNNRGNLGENAIFTYNGLSTERTTNTFQINGFEISLKAANKTDITFSSSPDTDKIFDSIKKFVDEYNKLIEDLNKQIREPKYRDFQPLTSEQKAEMKEKDIELWEEKAKSGTLRNDSIITNVLNEMRYALQGKIGGKTLKDIGITPSSDYLEYGKLTIDEDKLKAAISEDPSKLFEMFAVDSINKSEKGFARRIREAVDDSRKMITEKAGKAGSVNKTFALGLNLDNMNKQIERFEDKLKIVENRYWRQFTAMETAIQRANNQSAYLMNAFGGGQ